MPLSRALDFAVFSGFLSKLLSKLFQKWVLPWSLCFCCCLNEILSVLGSTLCTMKSRIANTLCHSNCCCVMSSACLRYCAWVLNQGSSITWKSTVASCFKHCVLVSTDWRVTSPTSASLNWLCCRCATYSVKKHAAVGMHLSGFNLQHWQLIYQDLPSRMNLTGELDLKPVSS